MIIDAEYEEVDETEADAEVELDLSEDDSLPWLEAEEDDGGIDSVDVVQIIGFALILLTILACVISAIWYFANRSDDAEMVADGSTIEAPEGPIKERPEDPGGKEFDGTGNVAPVVGEGGTREGVMDTDGNNGDGSGSGDGSSANGGGNSGAAGSSGANSGSGSTSSNASGSTAGVGVQLAAYSSRARAEQGWNDLRRRTNVLDGARYRIEEGVVDIGTVYRLQAVASDQAAADQLCSALRADGLDCQVKP